MMENFGFGSATLCEREKDQLKKSKALQWGMIGVLLCLVCIGPVSAAVPGQTWTRVNASAAWSDRSNFQTVVFNNKMWVIGGYDGGTWLNDTWSSSDGKIWTLVNASAGWPARSDHQVVVFKNQMWLLGGADGGFPMRDIWSSSDGKIWTLRHPGAPWSARDRFGAVVFRNKMYVIGGYPGYVNPSDVWSSDDGILWTLVNPSVSWSTRSDNAVVVYADKIWDLGGYSLSTFTDKNDTWSSNDGNIWTLVNPSANWSERSWHNAVVFDNKIWVLGGWNTAVGSLNDTWSSSDGNVWTRVNDKAPWPARAYFQAVTFQNKMWVLGGDDGTGRVNDVWSSDQAVPPAVINLNIRPNAYVVLNGTVATYSVILNSAPQGISGYNITIAVSNQTVGKIFYYTPPVWTYLFQNSTLPAGQAWFRAVDMDGRSGKANVTLFNFSILAQTAGVETISITSAKIDDRFGGKYTPVFNTATIQVLTDRNPFPIPQPVGGFFPLPTDPNRDRKFEDLDGNGFIGFNDVLLMFTYLDNIGAGFYGQRSYYDFDGNDDIGWNDVVTLNGFL